MSNYNQPRIIENHTILRDRRKPYTVFGYCTIVMGSSLNAPPLLILKENLLFLPLGDNTPILRLGELEASEFLAERVVVKTDLGPLFKLKPTTRKRKLKP